MSIIDSSPFCFGVLTLGLDRVSPHREKATFVAAVEFLAFYLLLVPVTGSVPSVAKIGF